MATQTKESLAKKFMTATQRQHERQQALDDDEKEHRNARIMAEIGNHNALIPPKIMPKQLSSQLLPPHMSRFVDHNPLNCELEAQETSQQFSLPQSKIIRDQQNGTDSKKEKNVQSPSELESAISQQRTENQNLDAKLKSEKQARAETQSQQRDLEKAQIQAILDNEREKVKTLEAQLSMLEDLAKRQSGTIADLQKEIDEGQQRESELHRQLMETRRLNMTLEADLTEKDVQNKVVAQYPMEGEGSEAAHLAAKKGSVLPDQSSPRPLSKGKRSSRGGQKEGFISVPRGQGGRATIPLILRSRC